MSFSCRKRLSRKKQRPNQLTLWDTNQILRCSPQTPKYLGSYILRFGSSRIYIHTSCTHTSITHIFVYNMLSTCVDVYLLPSYSIINSVFRKGRKSASMFGGNCFIQGFKWGLLLSKWEHLYFCSVPPSTLSDLHLQSVIWTHFFPEENFWKLQKARALKGLLIQWVCLLLPQTSFGSREHELICRSRSIMVWGKYPIRATCEWNVASRHMPWTNSSQATSKESPETKFKFHLSPRPAGLHLALATSGGRQWLLVRFHSLPGLSQETAMPNETKQTTKQKKKQPIKQKPKPNHQDKQTQNRLLTLQNEADRLSF